MRSFASFRPLAALSLQNRTFLLSWILHATDGSRKMLHYIFLNSIRINRSRGSRSNTILLDCDTKVTMWRACMNRAFTNHTKPPGLDLVAGFGRKSVQASRNSGCCGTVGSRWVTITPPGLQQPHNYLFCRDWGRPSISMCLWFNNINRNMLLQPGGWRTLFLKTSLETSSLNSVQQACQCLVWVLCWSELTVLCPWKYCLVFYGSESIHLLQLPEAVQCRCCCAIRGDGFNLTV